MESNLENELSVKEKTILYKTTIFWILTMGIVVFVFYHGDKKEIVSHISLASSIVSIAFAIIAVMYSYNLNRSQKTDSDNLQTQISKLNYVVERIDKSNEKLSEFDKMVTKLDLSIEKISDVKNILNKLYTKDQKELDSKESELGEPVPPPNTEPRVKDNNGKEKI